MKPVQFPNAPYPVVVRALLSLCLLVWAAAVQATPLRVVVISDLNGSYGSTSYSDRVSAAIDWIIAERPDLVISTGDMVAGQRKPHLTQLEIRAMWAAFHATVSDPLKAAGIPLAVTPGNHDASAYPGFETERRIYSEEWRSRRPSVTFIDDTNYPFFYAFEIDGVQFASLDATTLGPLSGDQNDRLRFIFRENGTTITFSHLPLFPFAIGREREIIGDLALEALYQEIGVDLHLSGHHHAFWPGWKDGVAYVSQACLGGGPRSLVGTKGKSPHALTLITIDETGSISIEARVAPDYRRSLDIQTLPDRIGDLIRIDKRR